MQKTRISVYGVSGRMGKWVTHLIETDYKNKTELGASASSTGFLEPLFDSDAIIDFSVSAGTEKLISSALDSKKSNLPVFVIGTTDWSSNTQKLFQSLSERTPVLAASNFSAGVFILNQILKQFSPRLLKSGFSPVMVETHHRHKKDAPSGTAVTLRKSISPTPTDVPIHSVRAGEVYGIHEITFFGAAETIELKHSAQDRSIWARGAIDVALWLSAKKKQNPKLSGLFELDNFFDRKE